jgi:hypothetical protein
MGKEWDSRQRGTRCTLLWWQDLYHLLGILLLDCQLLPWHPGMGRQFNPHISQRLDKEQ